MDYKNHSIFKRLEKLYDKKINIKISKISDQKDGDTYIYRRLSAMNIDNEVWLYDNSTDIYRPLNEEEIEELYSGSIDDFCDKLYVQNSIQRIKNNKRKMQVAILKENDKEKQYHYRIASETIKTLKNFLDINKKSVKFVNY